MYLGAAPPAYDLLNQLRSYGYAAPNYGGDGGVSSWYLTMPIDDVANAARRLGWLGSLAELDAVATTLGSIALRAAPYSAQTLTYDDWFRALLTVGLSVSAPAASPAPSPVSAPAPSPAPSPLPVYSAPPPAYAAPSPPSYPPAPPPSNVVTPATPVDTAVSTGGASSAASSSAVTSGGDAGVSFAELVSLGNEPVYSTSDAALPVVAGSRSGGVALWWILAAAAALALRRRS